MKGFFITGRYAKLVSMLVVGLVLSGCLLLPANDKEVIKSPNDDREYRYLTLKNNLKVLLIADVAAEKSAASLDVHVGSRHDPEQRQGLAHFLEHMLFLGTEKYPNPDEYQKFVSQNGGSHNAYTSFEHTNYFFDIESSKLEAALDRFADFFVAPRLDEDYIEREMNAVESEYRARIKDENRRIIDATKQIVNPQHPYHKFTVGSLQTLAGDGIRQDLLEFYRQYYSASRMTLAVTGNYSLDQLEAMVTTKFSFIPDNRNTIEKISVPLFLTGKSLDVSHSYQLPIVLSVQSEKPVRQLRFSFEMPDLAANYRSKALNYIGNIIGHEGKGSLLSELKAKGLANSLSAGVGLHYFGGSTFQVNITLTPEGVEQFNTVADLLFVTINLLREQQQDSNMIKTLYLEQQQLSEIDFRFYTKPSIVSSVMSASSNLQFYPPTAVIYGDYDFSEYRPDLIADRLARLVPENTLITLVSPELPGAYPANKVTRWFSAPYGVQAVAQERVAAWQFAGDTATAAMNLAADNIKLPTPNEFIPYDFNLLSAVRDSEKTANTDAAGQENINLDVPSMVTDQPGFRLWVKTDDDFEVPKTDAYFTFLTRYAGQSARHQALAKIYVRAVNEQLNELLYPAYLAGTNFSFYPHLRGFSLKLSGYSDSLEPLIQQVVPALISPTVSMQRFEDIKTELRRSLSLAIQAPPYQRLLSKMSIELFAQVRDESEIINELDSISQQDLQYFVDQLWSQVFIEGLVHGNVSLAAANQLSQSIRQLPNCQCDREGRTYVDIINLTAGKRWFQSHRLSHEDAAVIWYFQAQDDRLETIAKTSLLASIMHPQFFNELRTEQQLGYIVSAFSFNLHKWPGLALQVQSPAATEAEIIEAMQVFLQNFLSFEGGETDFEQHRAALASQLREQDVTLGKRSSRYWLSLALGNEQFNRRELLAKEVEAIDYGLWMEYVRQLLGDDQASLIQASATDDELGKPAKANIWPGSSSMRIIAYP